MCGIAGILRVTPPGEAPQPIEDSLLDSLDHAIAWRGPDGSGRFRDRAVRSDGSTVEVALIHRRLSIIDLACGAQPMVSASGERPDEGPVAVVFNGCVYNHRALRTDLERAGRRFATDHSDTETLIHAWRESAGGADAFDALRSMHAVALWDRASARLVLSRDRFGEKPLFVRRLDDRGSLVFSSVARGPLVADAERDIEGLADWLALGFGSRLPWRGVESVPRMRPTPPARSDPADLTPDSLDRLIERAVAQRLEADVPLGCFLSGGIDSSLVAHHARRLTGRLTTLCVRMPEAAYDESAHAQRVADHLGTDHVTLDISDNPAEDLVAIVRAVGLPIGDSSILPTYWLCRAARTRVKVALSGDGGDELFCGYERYRAAAWLRPLRGLARLLPAGLLDERNPKRHAAKAARLIRAARGLGYTDLIAAFPAETRRQLFSARGDVCERALFGGIDEARRFDLDEYLPEDLLRKVDTASMLAGIEVRCPLLAPEVAAAALRVPVSRHLKGGRTKALLREVAALHLPPETVNRPKQGFAVSFGSWLRNDFGGLRSLLDHLLENPRPLGWVGEALGLRRDALNGVIAEHMRGECDHGQRLFILMTMGIWANMIESDSANG